MFTSIYDIQMRENPYQTYRSIEINVKYVNLHYYIFLIPSNMYSVV
jgi:hypothetical protein